MKDLTKKTAKSYFIAIFSIAVMYVCTGATYLANTDLKGEWTYSESKSKAPQGNFRIAPLKLKITSEANGIAVERTSAGFNGGENFLTTDHLTFDGKASESTAFGNSKKKSVAVWSDDGKKLTVNSTIVFDMNGDSREFKSVEVFTLSDDGKSLSIAFSSLSMEGLNGTFVYDKTN